MTKGDGDHTTTVDTSTDLGSAATVRVDHETSTVTLPLGERTPSGAPRLVGRFRIDAALGSGGMADVYRAYDPLLDRAVALKVLHTKRSASDTQGMRRVLREARAAAALTHPNTVTIFEVGEADGEVFIAMELLQGSVLREVIDAPSDAPPTLEQKLRWLAQAARALATAHERGLVHRDVKPENMFVCSDGTLKLLDFGIAKRGAGDLLDESGENQVARAEPSDHDTAPSSIRTQAGRRLGTPRYMAPEQHAGSPTDARTDEYAWGLVAFELLCGSLVVGEGATATAEGEGDAAPVGASTALRIAELAVKVPELPAPLASSIARALEPSPADRFPSMAPIVEAFAALESRSSSEAFSSLLPPPNPGAPARRRWMLAAAVVVGGLAVVAGVKLRERISRSHTIASLLRPATPEIVPACRTVSTRVVHLASRDKLAVLSDGSLVFGRDFGRRGIVLDHETEHGFEPMTPGARRNPPIFIGSDRLPRIAGSTFQATVLEGQPALFIGATMGPDALESPLMLFGVTGAAATVATQSLGSSFGATAFAGHVIAAVTARMPNERFGIPAGLLLYPLGGKPGRPVPVLVENGEDLLLPSLAATPQRLAVAYEAPAAIHYALLDKQLQVLGDITAVVPFRLQPSVTLTNGEAAVFWTQRTDQKTRLMLATMALGASAFEPPHEAIDEPVVDMPPLSVALDDDSFAVAWVASRGGIPTLRFSPVGALGSLTGPSDVATATILRDLAVTRTPTGAAFSWNDGAGNATVAQVVCQKPTSRPER